LDQPTHHRPLGGKNIGREIKEGPVGGQFREIGKGDGVSADSHPAKGKKTLSAPKRGGKKRHQNGTKKVEPPKRGKCFLINRQERGPMVHFS